MEWLQGLGPDHKAGLDACAGKTAILPAAGALPRGAHVRRAAWLAAASGPALALAMSMDDFLHPWDERYNAVVARHLISHPLVPTLYEETPLSRAPVWGRGRVWSHKPPWPLWLRAASLRLLGACEFAVRLPSVLLR